MQFFPWFCSAMALPTIVAILLALRYPNLRPNVGPCALRVAVGSGAAFDRGVASEQREMEESQLPTTFAAPRPPPSSQPAAVANPMVVEAEVIHPVVAQQAEQVSGGGGDKGQQAPTARTARAEAIVVDAEEVVETSGQGVGSGGRMTMDYLMSQERERRIWREREQGMAANLARARVDRERRQRARSGAGAVYSVQSAFSIFSLQSKCAFFGIHVWFGAFGVNAVTTIAGVSAIGSIASMASICSVASIASVFSICSIHGVFAVGCAGGFFEICSYDCIPWWKEEH